MSTLEGVVEAKEGIGQSQATVAEIIPPARAELWLAGTVILAATMVLGLGLVSALL
jgi:hypothetical protein